VLDWTSPAADWSAHRTHLPRFPSGTSWQPGGDQAGYLPSWRTSMKSSKAIPIIFSLVLAFAATAHAEDKCESTDHGVSHTINGKSYVCDKCVILGCETSGSNIGKCTRTTKYTNCVEPPKPAKDKPATDKKK
jgi:hypothetical protein